MTTAIIESGYIVNVILTGDGWTAAEGVTAMPYDVAISAGYVRKPAVATEKIWPNSQAFMAEFSLAEMAAISLSTNPIIAALRMMLSTWRSEVHANHDDVITGLNALVSEGILTAERKDEILA